MESNIQLPIKHTESLQILFTHNIVTVLVLPLAAIND